MNIRTTALHFKTRGNPDVVEITGQLRGLLDESGLLEGTLVLCVVGSTGALTTCEYEPALVKDLRDLFARLIPAEDGYAHDATWGDANGFSHLRASLVGPSLVIPFVDGSLCLGTWQQVIFLEFDNRARSRTVTVQLQGV